MNMIDRILYLYMWKEELASKLGRDLSEEHSELFNTFGWWFDSISYERIKPDIDDLIYFEQKFAEIENHLE